MRDSVTAQIEELLDAQIAVAQTLASLLEEERAALTGTSPERVTETAAQKIRLLEQFEALEQQRQRVTEQHSSPTSSITPRWRSLMALLATCRNANDTNGLIVNLRQGQIRQLIDIVRGSPAITYGPHGQTFAAAVRPLARA